MEVETTKILERRNLGDQTLEIEMDDTVLHPVQVGLVTNPDDLCMLLRKETMQEDLESKPNFSEGNGDKEAIKQESEDDDFIPSPALRGPSMLSFFGADLFLVIQKIGTKYNNLLKKYHVKNSEAEVMQEKCLKECQPRFEALQKKLNEYQSQMSELEMLREKCEVLSNKCNKVCEPKYESLKKILVEESSERKRIYNELIELRGNIRVFCRCRPLSSEEISKGCTSVLEFDPSRDTELQIICADSLRKQFKFDHVFSPLDNQEAVFAETLPLVKSVMDGFNACIFAYGQTGTGKTFTMEGTPEYRGVNYRALEELFSISNKRSSMKYEFSVSMLEVYNEKIRDLLADSLDPLSKKLEIKQSAVGTQEIPGLAEVAVRSIDEVWEILKTGARSRSVGSTNANELSSRSHSLVRVTIKGDNLVIKQKSKSHLWLVDLAGSERVGKIEAEGERLKESQFINKSLSALGDVISALSSKNSYIPYRNSKLTHLLQSSLGGDCKTLMFAQISPSSADLGETLCTLNFASRVRGVEQGPAKKQSDPAEGFKLKQMAEKLRHEEKEVSKLNENLQLMHLKFASRDNAFRMLQEKVRESEQACKIYQLKIKELENQLAEERKTKAQIEASRSVKPPLAPPAKQKRPPLSSITNRLPPTSRYITAKPAPVKKENDDPMIKDLSSAKKHFWKARRVSLSPLVRNVSSQTSRRRPSLATEIETLLPLPEKLQLNNAGGASQLPLLRAPRRSSVATFNPLPRTPEAQIKFGSSSLKYSSPSQSQNRWKLNNFFSSSMGNSAQPQNKLCFSIQKRLLVASPAQARPSFLLEPRITNENLRGKEIIGRFGTAQRVLCSNRRRSIL
ncbi:Kinesin-4 [Apostasia shenzhenica]|uniref:Kinesin-like protein n=1 Tax=Apostasia shenzhenica TaxID=1088818 RepID=A0A2I0BB41_9ASPA|nr:Kinesin-4 [Apostasia shenzhenica]